MSTTNTTKSWFWYVRKKGRNWVLGIVDHNGVATATANLDIDYWYDEIPDEITSDNDTLPIPSESEHGFMMGVVYEVMRMVGQVIPSYKDDFEKEIQNAIHRQIEETQQPLTIAPIDMRMDQQRIRTKTRDA